MLVVKEWLRKWYFVPLLVFISALAYLPNIRDFGYFRDDWYLMYSANALGVKTFQGIFAIDRPVRAILMTGLYSLFGMNPLYYNLAAYVFRVMGALSFLWTLRLLWPRQRTATMVAAILFLIYPGFLSTPNAIDYQEKFVGLFLGHLSVALSIKSILSTKRLHKVLLWLPVVLTAGIYPSLVEYYFGLEVFRLLAIGLLAMRSSGGKIAQWVKSTFFEWIPFMVGPLGFVIWRFFIFESARKATDLGSQFGLFFGSPLEVGLGWVITLLRDSVEGLVFAWVIPIVNLWDISLRLREIFFAGVLAVAAVLVMALFLKPRSEDVTQGSSDSNWRAEAFWIGFICLVTGFIPVILSNREADLNNYSRYMLPSSSGVAIILMAYLDQFSSRSVRNVTIYLLVVSSIMMHYLNGVQWAHSSEAMQDFWWQVSWRIPQLEPGTTLVANYSHTAIEEDYFIWGPANLLFRPQSMDPVTIRPAIWGMVLSQGSVSSILTHAEPEFVERRTIQTSVDYGNILVLTQPTPSSCVQVLDGRSPAISEFEQYDIQSIARESDQSHILLSEQAPPPSTGVFGPEPERGWCYYYEKASLAYQRGEWSTVLELGKEAEAKGFSAGDSVEWMPFLQAAIYLYDRDTAIALAPKIKNNPFLAVQACETLTNLPELSTESKYFAEDIFCALGN
ncbi:MAG: hypothetical protein IPO22_01080 [Anaerolineales bacterium]|nr:hypothetical protein [Anaerolineales bacterium]